MAYVGLNPIRAKIADTPDTSDHTSIQQRLEAIKPPKKSIKLPTTHHSLMLFVGNPRQDMPKGIHFSFKDYRELVDISGRIIRRAMAHAYHRI